MVAVLNPGDKLGLPNPTKPNLILGIQDGAVAWTSQRPRLDTKSYHTYDLGPQTLTASVNYIASGTGSGKGVVVGDAAHPMGIGELSRGTTAAGRVAAMYASSASVIKLSSTSGIWVYECLTMVPTLSDGTDTFRCFWGLGDTINAEDPDGVYFRLDNPAVANLQISVAAAASRIHTDTGIPLVAGTWYRMRIVVTNDTQADFYLAVEGSPLAFVGSHTTGLPSGAGRETGWGMKILGVAGTADRQLRYAWQQFYREPVYTPNSPVSRVFPGVLNRGDGVGIPRGAEGFTLGMDENGKLAWQQRRFISPTQLVDWFVMDRANTREFFGENSGTGTQTSFTSEAQYPFSTFLVSGTTATGRTSRSMMSTSVPPAVALYSTSGTIVYETMFKPLHLSDGSNTHVFRIGFLNEVTTAPTIGAYFEIDANADPQIQCVVRNGTATIVDSGITSTVNQWYWARIVITNNSQILFYLAPQGSSLALVATITTNIPSGSGQAFTPGTVLIKSVGTTSHQYRVHYQMAYRLRP